MAIICACTSCRLAEERYAGVSKARVLTAQPVMHGVRVALLADSDASIVRALLLPLWLVVQQLREQQVSDPEGVTATWQQLETWCAEYAHPALTRDEVAAACDLHPGYISELFQRFTGDTFQSWHMRWRVERARMYIRDYPRMTMDSIAEHAGFSDARYMRRCYRRMLVKILQTIADNLFILNQLHSGSQPSCSDPRLGSIGYVLRPN